MAKLHERLRQLRVNSGLTQAEVAKRLYVTRQTVSSYESGRTKPDVEMLEQLAEVYGVPFQEVMGASLPVKTEGRKALRSLWALVGFLLLCVLARCVLLLVANFCYVVPEGLVTQEMMPVLQTRFSILEAADWLERGLLMGGCCLGVLLLVQRLQRMLFARRHWIAVGFLSGTVLVLSLLSAAADPLYGFLNYWERPA